MFLFILNDILYTSYIYISIRYIFIVIHKNVFINYYLVLYIYIYTHTHSLTGQFIRFALLVPGWTPFWLLNCINFHGIDSTRCWKHCSEILIHIDLIASRSCCRFVGCTSMMWISRSTTSQRCSIGLRSGDCGGHLSKVNSLSCSRNQSEMIWALWHGALSCWKMGTL